jgi:hypothetical protein
MQISHAIQSVEFLTEIRESALVFPILLTAHLACISVFGGMILMTDLRLLGVALKNRPVADVVNGLRNWKRFGFCLMVTIGALLGGSEAEKYSINPFFWSKMVCLACVGLHALAFRQSVYAKAAEYDKTGIIPGRARLAATLSLLIWTGLVTFGRLIGYYEPKTDNKALLIPPQTVVLPAQR